VTSTTLETDSRRPSRQDRQARVGILRNPNTAPRPPLRRAQLMGRWPSLRSGRRASALQIARATQSLLGPDAAPDTLADADIPAVPTDPPPGGALGIDLAGLIASVEQIGTDKPIRTPYGAGMRADLPSDSAPAPAPAKSGILSADAWLDDDLPTPLPPRPIDAAPPARRTRRWSRSLMVLGVGGIGLALAILALLPARPGL